MIRARSAQYSPRDANCYDSSTMFAARRQHLLERLEPGAIAIFPSAPVHVRNGDVEHEYRPDSDLFYLTGFSEPDAVVVLRPAHAEHPFVMFLRPRDPEREVWDGARVGIDDAVASFGASVAYPIAELAQRLGELVLDRSRLYYGLGRDRAMDDCVLRAIAQARGKARKGKTYPSEIVEPAAVLGEMRWRKSEVEIETMRRAAEITRDAFLRAYANARPGRYEYEIEGTLRETWRMRGSERPAYPPIVASGPNACVLHYVRNNRRMEAGDLLLIDAGAEYGGYACDVTRTFPVGGKFTTPQREIYELVLEAQLASIAAIAPGATIEQVHKVSAEVITRGLVRLGLLEGDVDKLITDEAFKKYFMHGTSHWLGMDVHDVGRYYVDGKPRPMEPGCVLTVEPGLYFSPTAESVPPAYRGIGVRIEDDVVCTNAGPRVLTHDIPKLPDEIERLTSA